MHLFGELKYKTKMENNSSFYCNVEVNVNGVEYKNDFTKKLTYSGYKTPIIEEITPKYVSITGGDIITIKGQNLYG